MTYPTHNNRPTTPPPGVKELVDAIFDYQMVPAYQIESYSDSTATVYWDHVEVILDALGMTPDEARRRIVQTKRRNASSASVVGA